MIVLGSDKLGTGLSTRTPSVFVVWGLLHRVMHVGKCRYRAAFEWMGES